VELVVERRCVVKQFAFVAVVSGLACALSACGATVSAHFSNDGSADFTGGTGGTGGSSSPSTGGVRATGGASSGGTTASGGTVSTGGTTASGGTVSTGGTTASGGTVSTGGTTASGGGTPGSGGQDSGPATCVGLSTNAEALEAIERRDGGSLEHKVPCEFALPAHTGFVTFDPTHFNVGVNSTGSAFSEIGHVASSSDCAGDGWYFGLAGSAMIDAGGGNATRDASSDASLGDASFDSGGTPAFVVLCPHTCNLATASSGPSVAYLLGCPTLEK
jgi:hypothetical protein